MLNSCIKPYEPAINAADAKKLVVSGQVTNLDGNQTITISRASATLKPESNLIAGCNVTIFDSLGHNFPMTDAGDGTYHGFIDPVYLFPGSFFKLEIITPEGDKVVSGFDRLSPGPGVDSVYYLRRDIPTNDPSKFIKGIQFYVNLDGSDSDSRFYRWKAVETWEYHAEFPVEWYYSFRLQHISPPDYSKQVCWLTLQVRNIYTLSSKGLSVNKYQMLPLNFVDNLTSRLVYGYSLLVNQYSLSEEAYNYWNQLRVNSSNEGGLYEKQPLATKGNLHNLTHPDEDVLGFFGASSVNSKRIFVSNVENLPLEYYSMCTPSPLTPYGLQALDPLEFPVYLLADSTGKPTIMLDKWCVDCRSLGGKNVKPEFWPN